MLTSGKRKAALRNSREVILSQKHFFLWEALVWSQKQYFQSFLKCMQHCYLSSVWSIFIICCILLGSLTNSHKCVLMCIQRPFTEMASDRSGDFRELWSLSFLVTACWYSVLCKIICHAMPAEKIMHPQYRTNIHCCWPFLSGLSQDPR